MQSVFNKVMLVIVALVVGAMSFRMVTFFVPQNKVDVDTSAGVSYLSALQTAEEFEITTETIPPTTEETTSETTEETTAEPDPVFEENPTATTRKGIIAKNNFRAAYKDTIIAGDSLVQALTEYSILSNKTVYAQVGASTAHLKKNTDKIVNAKPKYLILHYGENELDDKKRAPNFIKRYKSCIKTLKQKLPDTEIYVDSIFPVMDKAHKLEKYTVNIDYYNELIRDMCEELDVHYIDFDPLWASFEKNYYDNDGIHPVKKFYTEQYLPFVYGEVHGLEDEDEDA